MAYDNIPEPPPREGRLPWIKRFGAGAFTLSLLVHAIFIILAIFVLFRWVYPPTPPPPDFSGASGGGGGNQGQTANKVQTQMRRAMTTSSTRKIAVSGEASFTLPDNTDQPMEQTMPNVEAAMNSSGSGGGGGGGSGGGLGTGVGKGTGPGHGTGTGLGFNFAPSPFGSKTVTANALEGHLYDFKQTEKGVPVEYDVVAIEPFATRVLELQKRGFRELAFSHFFKAPDTLYLSQLVIKPVNADAGPAFFGAADKVKPSGWLAHYSGTIKAPRDIHFRFVGSADDYISVFSKSRPRLIACRPEIQATMQDHWEPSKTDKEYAGPMGTLIHGDWIKLKKDEIMPIEISIAERPGGIVGFLLLVEEKDVDYRKASVDDRPITPIFTTAPITPELQQRVESDFPGWGFDWEHVPVFGGVEKNTSDPFK